MKYLRPEALELAAVWITCGIGVVARRVSLLRRVSAAWVIATGLLGLLSLVALAADVIIAASR